MNILLGILLGGFFGFALYTAGATKPKKLLSMLRLEDLDLAKTILFGIGFASVLLAIANMVGIFDISHLSVKTLNTGVIIGGLIFGVGFGLAGTCPGTCVGASGTNGFKKGLSAVVGGLIGAFAFSMSYGYLNNMGLISGFNGGNLTLFNISPEYPSLFNVGYMGLMIVGLLFIGGAFLLPKSILKNNK